MAKEMCLKTLYVEQFALGYMFSLNLNVECRFFHANFGKENFDIMYSNL